MARSRFRLFYWLAIIGALVGYLLGDVALGTGMGLYVAPISAIIGVLLAWALHHTRPTNVSAQAVEPVDERMTTKLPERQRKTTSAVRVAKSQGQSQGGKKR